MQMKKILERVAFVLGTTLTCLGCLLATSPGDLLGPAEKIQETATSQLACANPAIGQAQGLQLVETMLKPYAPKTFGSCLESTSAIRCTPDQFTLALSDDPGIAEIAPALEGLATEPETEPNVEIEIAPYLIALNQVPSLESKS